MSQRPSGLQNASVALWFPHRSLGSPVPSADCSHTVNGFAGRVVADGTARSERNVKT
jgi:hypothetical protein